MTYEQNQPDRAALGTDSDPYRVPNLEEGSRTIADLGEAMNVPDPEDRVCALTECINDGDHRLRLAREARVEAIKAARAAGTTLRELMDLAGLSDSYLRRVSEQDIVDLSLTPDSGRRD